MTFFGVDTQQFRRSADNLPQTSERRRTDLAWRAELNHRNVCRASKQRSATSTGSRELWGHHGVKFRQAFRPDTPGEVRQATLLSGQTTQSWHDDAFHDKELRRPVIGSAAGLDLGTSRPSAGPTGDE